MKLQTYFLAIISLFLIASCKKDSKELTTEGKVIGKWTLVNSSWKETVGTDVQSGTDQYEANSYLEFKSSNVLVARVDGEITESVWNLTDNNKVLVIQDNGTLDLPQDGFEIRTLTSSDMVLYNKEVEGDDIYEVTINLHK